MAESNAEFLKRLSEESATGSDYRHVYAQLTREDFDRLVELAWRYVCLD